MKPDRPTATVARLALFLAAGIVLAGCSTLQSPSAQDKAAGATSAGVSAAMMALPEASLEAGRYDDALRQYQAIVGADPANKQAKLGIAEVQLATNNAQTAMELFTDLTQDPELHARALQGQGLALLRMDQRDSALGKLKDAVAADAKLWRAWNALGALYDADGNWTEADHAYHEALALKPSSAIVQNNFGFSHLMRKDLTAAIESFQRALRLEPGLEAAQMNLRIALAMQGRYGEALAGLHGKQAPATLNNVGVAAMSRGDLKSAETYLVQALDASPSQYDMASKNLQRLKILQGQDAGSEPQKKQ
jgi:Flp pilus assembly protein TadD